MVGNGPSSDLLDEGTSSSFNPFSPDSLTSLPTTTPAQTHPQHRLLVDRAQRRLTRLTNKSLGALDDSDEEKGKGEVDQVDQLVDELVRGGGEEEEELRGGGAESRWSDDDEEGAEDDDECGDDGEERADEEEAEEGTDNEFDGEEEEVVQEVTVKTVMEGKGKGEEVKVKPRKLTKKEEEDRERRKMWMDFDLRLDEVEP
ncbi:hypothetical protein JAAARDRAFT_424129 [Jaapia argillacea MUCL 33604]|uniref:Uncharacterized protein n=1 Tax=Jaapia argillacea MUCL 33604 TaxID=933084 RepID=A0A067PFX4_9AGAM|nr:hypothetical protein JAAARDRAFT_424129 [Jaapia argillacea MUCL 33604]